LRSLAPALSGALLLAAAVVGPAAAAAIALDQRQAVSVSLQDTSGTHLGSGVVIAAAAGGYWLVSNRHVVSDSQAVCVVTADRQVSPALVLPEARRRPRQAQPQPLDLDLALLWLPRNGAQPLAVATLAQRPAPPASLPLVQATGYPAPVQQRGDAAAYQERAGLLLPLLNEPLEGGFDLAYTAALQKGMSGGGVFSGSDLIGINGAHANPLWPGQWNDQNGRPVSASLNEKLELVSLGISVRTIQAALNAAVIPSAAALNGLTAVACRPSQPVRPSPDPIRQTR